MQRRNRKTIRLTLQSGFSFFAVTRVGQKTTKILTKCTIVYRFYNVCRKRNHWNKTDSAVRKTAHHLGYGVKTHWPKEKNDRELLRKTINNSNKSTTTGPIEHVVTGSLAHWNLQSKSNEKHEINKKKKTPASSRAQSQLCRISSSSLRFRIAVTHLVRLTEVRNIISTWKPTGMDTAITLYDIL